MAPRGGIGGDSVRVSVAPSIWDPFSGLGPAIRTGTLVIGQWDRAVATRHLNGAHGGERDMVFAFICLIVFAWFLGYCIGIPWPLMALLGLAACFGFIQFAPWRPRTRHQKLP
jgi:hypothetical protein